MLWRIFPNHPNYTCQILPKILVSLVTSMHIGCLICMSPALCVFIICMHAFFYVHLDFTQAFCLLKPQMVRSCLWLAFYFKWLGVADQDLIIWFGFWFGFRFEPNCCVTWLHHSFILWLWDRVHTVLFDPTVRLLINLIMLGS